MKKVIFFLLASMCFFSAAHNPSISQVIQQWVHEFNGPSGLEDGPSSMAVDASGNIYITGSTRTPSFMSASDYATIKYSLIGTHLWTAFYNGPATSDISHDVATGIAVDNSGNVYVTGVSRGGTSSLDFATIKYNPNGVQMWEIRYNGPTNSIDQALGIAVDNLSNVYVTGSSEGQIATIKYDSSGNEQWIMRFSGDSYAAPTAIKLDASGNVFVIGSSDFTGQQSNCATIKYNSSGLQQWAMLYNGPGNFHDEAQGIAFDSSGNVYVTGLSWGIGTDRDYATIKYDSAGFEQWVRRYNGPGNYTDIARAIGTDLDENIYITGRSFGDGTSYDYATIKYNSNGDSIWVRRYDYGAVVNRDDVANSLVLDKNQNVYITGSSSRGTFSDYLTIKYTSSGTRLWHVFYGTASNDDLAIALNVDFFGNVLVTGSGQGMSGNYDYITVMYSQSVGISQISNSNPDIFSLAQNYPNPFNPSTIINYELGITNLVSLKVYDVLGNEVSTLVNENQNTGSYSVTFDGANLSSGIYFYKLETENFSEVKKMTLLK